MCPNKETQRESRILQGFVCEHVVDEHNNVHLISILGSHFKGRDPSWVKDPEELQRMRLLTRELQRAEEESKTSKQERTRAYREELNRFQASRAEEEKTSSGIDFNTSFFSKFGTSAR